MSQQPEKAKLIMANVLASMAVEGLRPSSKAQATTKMYLQGKISSEEAIRQIKLQHATKFKERAPKNLRANV